MKKINLLILTLIIVPQVLFSQIKKIDKGTKQNVSKTIKGGNSKGNNKALNAYPGYHLLKRCFIDASPQGFTFDVRNLQGGKGKSDIWVMTVYNGTPMIYSHKIDNVTIHPPVEEEIYLGDQSPNHGVLNGGSGWARDESGIILYGKVYRYTGNKFGRGNVYHGSMQRKEGVGLLPLQCSQSSLNLLISTHMSGVPRIEGSAIAFNDHSEPTTSSSPTVIVNNNQSGGTYTMDNYVSLFDAAFKRKILGDFSLNKLTTQAEYDALRIEIRKLNYDEYVAFNEGNPFLFRHLENDHYSLTPIEEEDVQLDISPNNLQEIQVIPTGFGTPNYPSPKAPGGAFSTKKIYPSYLFDAPKEQSWYAGNSLANQNVGPGATIYKHNPLPSYCNPNNDDYIPAAFLNSLVLEELRQDWKYLTYKNEAELKAKGYDFYDEYYTKFMNECRDCDKELITENPNLKRKTYIDPNGTMPLINNTNSQNGTQKSKLNDDENTLPRPKLLVKTENYYSDLINNKLITMNPVWLANKQQKKCMPKISAIHNSINKGKKLKINKHIKKQKY